MSMKPWFAWQRRRSYIRPDRAAIGVALVFGLLILYGILAPAGARW